MIEHKVTPDGTQTWYKEGVLHREDGPAIIWSTGSQVWFKNGAIHREGGPAVIWADGQKEWWVNGKQVDPLVLFVRQKETA